MEHDERDRQHEIDKKKAVDAVKKNRAESMKIQIVLLSVTLALLALWGLVQFAFIPK